MKLSPLGLWFLKHRETKDGKPDLVAYKDPGSKDGLPITAGYGSTRKLDGTRFTLGERITEKYAEDCLLRDVAWAEAEVSRLVKVPLNSNQFDALVSFSYNVGTGKEGLAGSTLLRLLNAGDYDAAADQMMRWVFNDGVKMKGLENRRFLERRLFKFEPRNIATVPQEEVVQGEAPPVNDPVDPPTIMVPPGAPPPPVRKQVPVPPPALVPGQPLGTEPPPPPATNETTSGWSALRAGWVLTNATTWKNRQIAIAALVTILTFGVGILKVAGYDLGWSESEITSIAGVLFALGYGLFNLWATAATTSRVGLPTRNQPDPEPPSNGGATSAGPGPGDNPYVG